MKEADLAGASRRDFRKYRQYKEADRIKGPVISPIGVLSSTYTTRSRGAATSSRVASAGPGKGTAI